MKKLLLLIPLLLHPSCMLQQPVRNTDMPEAGNSPIPTRVGTATGTTWFWLWETGDASVERAQQNGGITKVSSVTRATDSFLGFVKKHTTTVRGD